jgi:SAM-dependent methyltransferase
MTVFDGVYAGGYDALYKDKNYGAECDLAEQALARFKSGDCSKLLDIGCGTGGHAIELAARGYSVHGVDLSPHMLDIARAKAAGKPRADSISWQVADARSFETPQKFDAAIMMFAVLGYLNSNEDVLAALGNIRRHLRVGAVFACDFWYGPAVLTQRPGDRVRVVTTPSGKLIRVTHTELDVNASVATVNFDLYDIAADRLVGETNETHRMRYFFATDLALLLERAGFSLRQLSAFPGLDAPLSADTWNAFAVATAV